MHRFIAAIEKVSQIAELPPRVAFDNEDVGAGVGDGRFKFPSIVIGETLSFEPGDLHLIIADAAFLGELRETNFLAMMLLRNGDLSFL